MELGATVYGCDIIDGSETAKSGVIMQLTDRQAATAWIASIEMAAGSAIDVLASNAGGVAGQSSQPIEEVTDAEWDIIFAINVNAAFTLCRAAVPAMKRAGHGRIITTSSGAGLRPSLTGIQAYCSTKHAVVGLTKQLAHELGPFGITVNSVAPGLILSNPATEVQWASYARRARRRWSDRIALRRLGTALDIANAVVFFASDLAGFVNGQILSVDGGI